MMTKDRALTRAFLFVETLNIAGLSALQLLEMVNSIATEFQKIYGEGRTDRGDTTDWPRFARTQLEVIPKVPE